MTVDAAEIFRYPVRSADVWGLNDDPGAPQRPQEDIAADLDFQDNAVEDYLSNTIPNLYIQQSSLGSGIIDPAQLANGTPGAGKAPVGNPPTWTDVATQSELNAHESDTTNVHGLADTSKVPILDSTLQRGSSAVTLNGTTTTRAVVFSSAFASAPVVNATPHVASDLAPAYVNLTVLATTGFTYRISAPFTTTVSALVYWTALTP